MKWLLQSSSLTLSHIVSIVCALVVWRVRGHVCVCVCVCVCVVRALEIYSLSQFPAYNTVSLTSLTTLSIIRLGLFILSKCMQLSFLWPASLHFPCLPATGYPILLPSSCNLTLLDSTYLWDHEVFSFCVWFILLHTCPPAPAMLLQMAGSPFFL